MTANWILNLLLKYLIPGTKAFKAAHERMHNFGQVKMVGEHKFTERLPRYRIPSTKRLFLFDTVAYTCDFQCRFQTQFILGVFP